MQRKKQLLSVLFILSLGLIGAGVYGKTNGLSSIKILMPFGILLQTIVVAWALTLFATTKEKR